MDKIDYLKGNLKIGFIIAVLLFFINPSLAIPNPSATYCVNLGYQYKIMTDSDRNQYGICVFPNGESCIGWDFYNGKCGEEYSYEGDIDKDKVINGLDKFPFEPGSNLDGSPIFIEKIVHFFGNLLNIREWDNWIYVKSPELLNFTHIDSCVAGQVDIQKTGDIIKIVGGIERGNPCFGLVGDLSNYVLDVESKGTGGMCAMVVTTKCYEATIRYRGDKEFKVKHDGIVIYG